MTLVIVLAMAGAPSAAAQSAPTTPATDLEQPNVAAWRAAIAYGDPVGPIASFSQATGNASDWASFDKLQHVTFSFLFTLSVQYALVNKLDVSTKTATPISAGSSLAIGLTKELYDRHLSRSGSFDFKDLVADAVGIMLATGLILL